MSISFYTGVPGSGKSYHLARDIYQILQKGQNCISNFKVNEKSVIPKKNVDLGKFVYVPNEQFLDTAYRWKDGSKKEIKIYSQVQGLINFAWNFHYYEIVDGEPRFREHQTVVILDECHRIFNTRLWNKKDRQSWNDFLAEHRKFGFDFILTSQDDKKIDKHIRGLLEDEYLHRKFFNFVKNETLAFVLRKIFGEWFVCIKKKYGLSKKNKKCQQLLLEDKKNIMIFITHLHYSVDMTVTL